METRAVWEAYQNSDEARKDRIRQHKAKRFQAMDRIRSKMRLVSAVSLVMISTFACCSNFGTDFFLGVFVFTGTSEEGKSTDRACKGRCKNKSCRCTSR
jgi:hypothetical protein